MNNTKLMICLKKNILTPLTIWKLQSSNTLSYQLLYQSFWSLLCLTKCQNVENQNLDRWKRRTGMIAVSPRTKVANQRSFLRCWDRPKQTLQLLPAHWGSGSDIQTWQMRHLGEEDEFFIKIPPGMMLGMGRKRSSWERQSLPWAKRWYSTGELVLPLSSYQCKFVSGNNKKLSKKLSNFQSFGPKSEKVGEFTLLCTMSNAMLF